MVVLGQKRSIGKDCNGAIVIQSTNQPVAPHLTEKGRAWYKVEIEDFTEQKRPENQGGLWFLANRMKIIERV